MNVVTNCEILSALGFAVAADFFFESLPRQRVRQYGKLYNAILLQWVYLNDNVPWLFYHRIERRFK